MELTLAATGLLPWPGKIPPPASANLL